MKHRTSAFLILLLCFFSIELNAQIVPPYHQNFDSVACTGWNHYAISGTDCWERGVPYGPYLNQAASTPNVWATRLSGMTDDNSIMALQTPDFDLSDITKEYLLCFGYEIESYSYHGGNVEYSLDYGATWTLLNGTAAQKIGWYTNSSCAGLGGQPSWSFNFYSYFSYPAHSLIAFQGQPHIRFRFKYGGLTNSQDGWSIDNFSVVENIPNIVAVPGVTYNAGKNFATFDVNTSLIYNALVPPVFSNTTNYYFSYDNVLDAGDSLLGNKVQTIAGSPATWVRTFNMVPGLYCGDYYVFYTHDFANNLAEGNETDNTNFLILHIDSTFNAIGYKDDHEDSAYWKTNLPNLRWIRGKSNIHQAEGAHSGSKTWYTTNLNYEAPATTDFLESPWLDFSASPGNTFCFWYKTKRTYGGFHTKMQMSDVNGPAVYSPGGDRNIIGTRLDGWDCHCEDLWYLNGKNSAKIRFAYTDEETYGLCDQNYTIDDFYMGPPKPDVTIENKNDLFTQSTFPSDTIKYMFFNGGLTDALPCITEFYWSADTILDGSDPIIASVNEPLMSDTSYRYGYAFYTKPTTATGDYYIIYKTDATALLDEMWEENNIGYFKLRQQNITTVPYYNDFETQVDNWYHDATIGQDAWDWGSPAGALLSSAFSGTKALHTTADSVLPLMMRSHLYSPVFDLSGVSHPVMEFDMRLNGVYNCSCSGGQMNMTYSTDGGTSWKVLDTLSQSYNRWYYPMDYDDMGGIDENYYLANYTYLLFGPFERSFAGDGQYNGRNLNEHTRYVLDLGFLTGIKDVRFRFNIASDNNYSGITMAEGAIIDNFRIRNKFIDLKVIQEKALMQSSVRNAVNFNLYVRNQGNYYSNPTSVGFYLSADTVIGGADFYLGSDSLKRTRPYMNTYLNEMFTAPGSLSTYSYLLYKVDPFNQNAESNEVNNTGYWSLALDSVSTFPYIENFNDSVVDGWNQYTMHPVTGIQMKDQWRFRNLVAPAEYIYSSGIQSGQMFSDRLNNVISSGGVPYMHLETPVFNFSTATNIHMSFDMLLIGHTSGSTSGGNMEYSINGGNTWTNLQSALSVPMPAYHWYNSNSVSTLGSVPGWTFLGVPITLLDSVFFDLSFLSGQSQVLLRWRYRSNASPAGLGTRHGLRIDNFRIDADPGVPTVLHESPKPQTQMYLHEDLLNVVMPLAPENDRFRLNIINATGQLIYSKEVIVIEGMNQFTIPLQVAQGVYTIQLVNNSENLKLRFVRAK